MNLTKSKLDIDEKFLYQYEGDKYLSDDKMPDYVNIIKEEDDQINGFRREKIIKKRNKNLMKLKLKDLMTINPYHYVPKKVIFSTSINNNLISNQLSGNLVTYEEKGKINFPTVKNQKSRNKKNRKMISSYSISFPDPNFKRDELIWRLIPKITITKGVSSFKQAVKYEAITKVWKVHSLIIEKLLVNYQNFKWFLVKSSPPLLSNFNKEINSIKTFSFIILSFSRNHLTF